MDPPDSDTDCPGPYDTAFETFYEKMDDWAKCLAKLKPDDAARLRAAAAGLTAIIESLPDPSHFAASPAMTEAEALAFTGGPLFSPGAHEPA